MLCIGYFSISSSLAQISEGGLPPSFQFAGSLRSEKLAEQVPVNFSVEDLETVDAWRVSQGAPLRVAKSIPTSFDIADSGDWISLPDGSQVWQLHLQAKGAIALILYYSDFISPKVPGYTCITQRKPKYWVPIRIVRILKTDRSQPKP